MILCNVYQINPTAIDWKRHIGQLVEFIAVNKLSQWSINAMTDSVFLDSVWIRLFVFVFFDYLLSKKLTGRKGTVNLSLH